VDEQRMFGRVDSRHAGMVHFVVQGGGGDDARASCKGVMLTVTVVAYGAGQRPAVSNWERKP
jgi:hypothetical protein